MSVLTSDVQGFREYQCAHTVARGYNLHFFSLLEIRKMDLDRYLLPNLLI